MAFLNKVMLIGNIGKDPQFGVTTTGRNSVRFSLATSKRYRDANGEQKEQTEWHTIVGWGKTSEIVQKLGIQKGTTLYVEGELTNRSWTDQATGQKRYSTEVNMSTFQVLTPRNGASQQAAPAYDYSGATQQPTQQPDQAYTHSDDDDLDLPF